MLGESACPLTAQLVPEQVVDLEFGGGIAGRGGEQQLAQAVNAEVLAGVVEVGQQRLHAGPLRVVLERTHNARVRTINDIVANQQFFVQLLARAQAAVNNLDITTEVVNKQRYYKLVVNMNKSWASCSLSESMKIHPPISRGTSDGMQNRRKLSRSPRPKFL